MRVLAILLLLIPTGAAAAQRVGGYAKNLLLESSSLIDGESYWLDITRLRLQSEASLGAWEFDIWTDIETRTGSFFERPEADFALSGASDRGLDLDWEISRGDRHQIVGRVFRATMSNYGERYSVVIGRQRIAWGTGFVWTPTDLLNPVSPTSIERDEKGAVDAVSVSVETGLFSGFDMVVADNPRRGASPSLAARFRSHLGEYDASLTAGSLDGRPWIGGDFAGYVGNAGLRGELAVVRGIDRVWEARGILNMDYTFAAGVYSLVELHYNGPGAASKSAYDHAGLFAGNLTNLGRWYVAGTSSYPLSPLVTVSGYVISNIGDGSGLLGPSLMWSMTSDLQAAISAYVFFGASTSEFGAAGRVGFLSLQYFF